MKGSARPFESLVRFLIFFDFILEKPATRPRDRCGKEQLVYPFVTGFPGSSRVSALAPYSSGDRVGSTLSTPHAGGDLGPDGDSGYKILKMSHFGCIHLSICRSKMCYLWRGLGGPAASGGGPRMKGHEMNVKWDGTITLRVTQWVHFVLGVWIVTGTQACR